MFEYGDKEKIEMLHDSFTRELKALLTKYDVILEAHDHWTGYAECGQDIRILAEFEQWDIDDLDFGQEITKE